jgi:hypothetical protein
VQTLRQALTQRVTSISPPVNVLPPFRTPRRIISNELIYLKPKTSKKKAKQISLIKAKGVYTPSVEAIIFNIRGKPSKSLTGLDIRPLVG